MIAPEIAKKPVRETAYSNAPRPYKQEFKQEWFTSFLIGAKLPKDTVLKQNPEELMELLGNFVWLVIENIQRLYPVMLENSLKSEEDVDVLNNNPLKIHRSAQAILQIMLSPPSAIYLPYDKALQRSFDDIKEHQNEIFISMKKQFLDYIVELFLRQKLILKLITRVFLTNR